MDETDKILRKYTIIFFGISFSAIILSILFILSINANVNDNSVLGEHKQAEAFYAIIIASSIPIMVGIYCAIRLNTFGILSLWSDYVRNLPVFRWILLIVAVGLIAKVIEGILTINGDIKNIIGH